MDFLWSLRRLKLRLDPNLWIKVLVKKNKWCKKQTDTMHSRIGDDIQPHHPVNQAQETFISTHHLPWQQIVKKKKKPFTFTGCHFFCVDVISDNIHSDISLVFHVTNYLLLVSRKQPRFKDITRYSYLSSCGVCLCIPPRPVGCTLYKNVETFKTFRITCK